MKVVYDMPAPKEPVNTPEWITLRTDRQTNRHAHARTCADRVAANMLSFYHRAQFFSPLSLFFISLFLPFLTSPPHLHILLHPLFYSALRLALAFHRKTAFTFFETGFLGPRLSLTGTFLFSLSYDYSTLTPPRHSQTLSFQLLFPTHAFSPLCFSLSSSP